jgi:Tfp pilus assembly ATPase PilU
MEMCIKNPEKTGEILTHMAKSRDYGMQTFDQHLMDLVRERRISMEAAMIAAEEAEQLERELTLEI